MRKEQLPHTRMDNVVVSVVDRQSDCFPPIPGQGQMLLAVMYDIVTDCYYEKGEKDEVPKLIIL